MKTPTPPAVSEELDIPKPAPGENVYPIYSQGVICGYIHSGGNQKTHKIFLNGENQISSTENKGSKLKTNDSKKKSCSAKLPPKIAAKRTSTQSVSSRHKKAKTVSSTGKIPVLPNVPRIESNILKNPSDKLNIPYTPTNRSNGDAVNLGNKGRTSTDSVPMQVPIQTSSELASSKAKQKVQQIQILNTNTDTNTKSSVVMTSSSLCSLSSSSITNLAKKIVPSSNVTPSTKDTVVLSPPVMNNFNQPILLASNNLALQPTNWMTPQIQPSWPNPVAYVIMPTSHDLSQTPVYLANSTNNLPPVLPKTTNVSLTTATTTTTTTVPPGPVIQPPSITTSTATTASITKPSKVTTTTNSCNQLLTMLPLKGVVPKSTFVQLPLQLSSSSSISKRQPTYSPFKHLKILEQTNSETENNAFEAASAVNVSSENLAIQQSSKQEADNSVPALPSLHYLLSNDENTNQDSLSIDRSARSNESDVSSPELNKTVEEKTIDTNLSVNSNQKDKSDASPDATVSISDENKNPPCQSLPENVKFTLVPIRKRRGRPRKPLVPPPKYERKQIPILPATANTDGKPAGKPHAFNLLPSGNYVICFQNEGAQSGAQSDELNVDNSQHEPNQQVICEKAKKGRGRKSKSKPSLCEEENEMPHLPKQNEISMKMEPFDEDSELYQEECENLSNNCASSVSPSVTDVQMNLPIKEEKGLEDESTIQEENELVISNCFSLSSPTESHKKFIPFSMANSGLDNLFFFPNQTDLSHKSLEAPSIVQDENSTKVAEEVKLKKCSVKLEQLNFPSESLVEPSLSSSEEEENNLPYSSSEENNLPCTKPAEDTHTLCNSTLKEDESNVATVGSSADASTDTKISVKTPAKSILNLEYLKKLKNNFLSVEKDEFPVVPSDSNEASLGSKSKSLSLSKDILLTSGSINDSLKPFNKSFGDLPFTADSFVANLPKGDEADAFIEGCIAFHQQQLYLLQLQMDQHKSILEKLKKAQTCLKGTK